MTKQAPVSSLPGVAELLGERYTPALKEAFPDIRPPYAPFGYNTLLQLRMPRRKVGSLIIPDDAVDVERYRTQAALVRSLGVACFTDRQTGAGWVEGAWFGVGDFVRCPMFGGDRFDVEFKDVATGQNAKTTFVFVKEADVVALVTGDPLNITTS